MHLQNVFLLRNRLNSNFFFFVCSFDNLCYTSSDRTLRLVCIRFFFSSFTSKKASFFRFFFFLFPCCTFCPLNQACYRYDKISLLFLYILLVIMVDRLPGYQMVQPIYRICRERIEFLTIFFFFIHLISIQFSKLSLTSWLRIIVSLELA